MTSVPISKAPRLLVSVRSLAEAVRIRNSSCAIVDVKEPANGPLGRASLPVQVAVAESCRGQKVSLALGEVVDWQNVEIPPVNYLKLGLAGLGSDPKWRDRWLDVRAEADTSIQQAATWVAVGYADHERADAPAPRDILEAAVESECGVLLLDTFDKSAGRSLFDRLTVSELIELRSATTNSGLSFAIAGQLRSHHLDLISNVAPDIVGIRGAACVGNARQNEISSRALEQFADAIGAEAPVSGP